MNRIITIIICVFFNSVLIGQPDVQWAGPDTVTCGEKGVMLGVSTSCPGCCFSWSPEAGLDDPKIQNPTARPKKDTKYSVIVTDGNLSWKKTDDVNVTLSFGELHFIPDHLEQGTEEISLVKLQKNTGNFSTTWSFQGDDLGCLITPVDGNYNRATVYPGDEYGKLLVKVTKNADTACYFVDTLPVNNGVKDLKVIDLNTPNRFATTGQTLYLVSNNPDDWNARLIAIPNEGGFSNGIPDYHQDSYMTPLPIDGEDDQIVWDAATPPGKTSDYLAGDDPGDLPYVTIVRKIPSQTPIDGFAFLQNLQNFWNEIESLTNFADVDFNAPGSPPEGPCPEQTPFNFDADWMLGATEVDVEKYGYPSMGKKKEYTISAFVNIGGKIYHPQFSRHLVVLGVGICSELYAGITFNSMVQLGMSSDESKMDSSWNANDPKIELGLSGAVGFSAVILSGTGYNLEASGSATISLKAIIEYLLATKQVVAFGQFDPATIKVEARIVNENDMGEFEPLFNLLSKEIVLFKPLVTDKVVIHDFND